MTKNKHLTKLTEIQKNYAAEVAAVDRDLSPEGEAKRVQRVRDKYSLQAKSPASGQTPQTAQPKENTR